MTPDERREQLRQEFLAVLDDLDEKTRLPGEPPLREAVAQQARERLTEMKEEGR